MKNVKLLGAFLVLSFFVIVGCGGGGSSTAEPIVNPDIPASGIVTGTVRSYTKGEKLVGINISVGSAQGVTTSVDGTYSLSLDASSLDNVVVKASGVGYAETSKVTNANTSLDIYMLPVAFSSTFDSSQDYLAQVTGSTASVAIEGGSLVDSSGNQPSGSVTANLTPINPALDINLMPGIMVSNTGDSIESYGAIVINFTDASGNALNLSSGKTATIRIPAVFKSNVTPSSVPLYYYNEVNGNWIEEGVATLSADGTYYEGTVGHFSTWNVDVRYDSISIKGCVQDVNGIRISNVSVEMEGFDYIGSWRSNTDSNGDFTVMAKKDAVSIVSGTYMEKETNTVRFGDDESTSSDIIMSECLVLAPLTARLTWGENPSDLDTHVMDGSDYHIWYENLGSFSSDYAQLDVDDVTSYGPEIFTALKFPKAGTYHYSVYHYEGISTISASPARVEVVFDGQTTLFTPPAGQGVADTWWNVFDIIVDDNNAMTIQPVNTWTTKAPNGVERYKSSKN